MKTKHLLVSLSVISFMFILFSSFRPYGGGAPSPYYYTGSPGDAHSCASCHGNSSTVAGWITSNIPASGYVPGTVYQITASNSVTGSGKYGFEVSPQNPAGTLLGTLAPGTGSKLVGSGKWITHSNASNSVTSWTFNWTAPVAGTGVVTFYGSFTRGTSAPTKLSTLVVNEAAGGLPGAAGPISGPTVVCPNTTVTYSVAAITGATTYNWTLPAGATIVSGAGTNTISVNFGAGATSGNITVYGSNGSGNGASSSLPITVSSAPSSAGSIAGQTQPCQGTTQTYTVTNTAGVTYTWTVPSGTSISSGQGTNSLSVTVGPNNGNIEVVPSNTCGSAPASALAITVNPLPAQPGTITGPTASCQGESASYTVSSVAGITYNWTVPSGSTITSGQGTNTINVTIGSSSGNVEVVPSNTCGNGPGRSLAITVNIVPAQPSFIAGTEWPCQGSSVNYSVTNVAGTSYTWAVPSGSSISAGQGTNSITVLIGATNGNITVTPSNNCGTGTPQTKVIQVSTVPAQPGQINGATEPCQGTTQVYTVLNVSGLTYNWTVPSGTTISSGQGTNSIFVLTGSTAGNIEVVATNNCGNSPGQVKPITPLALPGSTGAITGPSQVNPTTTITSQFSTTGASNANTYTWELLPAEAGSISGIGLTAVAAWNSTFSGTVTIRARGVNACGEGSWSDIKEVILLNNTGIADASKAIIEVYPNPNNGKFTLTLNTNSDYIQARILDAAGIEVYKDIIPGNGSFSMDLDINPGMYILLLESSNQSLKHKILVK
jgi:hypothetical protein